MSWLSTHPKLERRILRLVPGFDLTAPVQDVAELKRSPEPSPSTEPLEYNPPGESSLSHQSPGDSVAMASVLPSAWFDWAHSLELTPVYFLAIVRDPIPAMDNLKPLAELDPGQRLDLMNLIAPKLRRWSEEEVTQLYLDHRSKITEDGVITPLELAAHRLLKDRLSPSGHSFLRSAQPEPCMAVLLNYVAHQFPEAERARVYIGCVNRLRHQLDTANMLQLGPCPAPKQTLHAVHEFDQLASRHQDLLLQALDEPLRQRPLLRQGLGLPKPP